MNKTEALERRIARLENLLQNEEINRVDEFSLFGFGDKTKTHQKIIDTIIAAIKKYAHAYITNKDNFRIESKPNKTGFTISISPMYYSKFWRADERVDFQIKGSSKMKNTGKAGFTIDYSLYTGDATKNGGYTSQISTTRKVFSMDDLKKAVMSIDDFIIEWKKRNKVESLKRRYRRAIDC